MRGRELAAANKNSKGAPTAMSSLVVVVTMFPMHTFSGAISTTSTHNLGHGGGSSLGADVLGRTLVCRCRSVVAAGRAISVPMTTARRRFNPPLIYLVHVPSQRSDCSIVEQWVSIPQHNDDLPRTSIWPCSSTASIQTHIGLDRLLDYSPCRSLICSTFSA